MIKNFLKLILISLLFLLSACSIQSGSNISAEETLVKYSNAILTRNPVKESEYMHKDLLHKFKKKIRKIVLNTKKSGQPEILQIYSKVKNIKEFDKLSAKEVYIRLRTRTYNTKLKNIPLDQTAKLSFILKKKLNNKYIFMTKFISGKTGRSYGKRVFTLIKEKQSWKIIYIEKLVGIDDLPTQ